MGSKIQSTLCAPRLLNIEIWRRVLESYIDICIGYTQYSQSHTGLSVIPFRRWLRKNDMYLSTAFDRALIDACFETCFLIWAPIISICPQFILEVRLCDEIKLSTLYNCHGLPWLPSYMWVKAFGFHLVTTLTSTQQQTWIRGGKGRGRGRGGGSIASYFCAIPKSAVPALKLLQALASPGVPREKKVWDHDPSAHRTHYRCLLARTPQSKLALCIHGNVKERNRELPV